MKRILTLSILVAAMMAATAGVAQARTTAEGCGLKSVGAPVLTGDSTTISSSGVARCNVRWRAIADLQVEQNGTWQTAFADGNPVPPQVAGPYTAKVDHVTDYSWSMLDVTPYCSYNWRVVVTYTDGSGNQIGVANSPETTHTCSKTRRS